MRKVSSLKSLVISIWLLLAGVSQAVPTYPINAHLTVYGHTTTDTLYSRTGSRVIIQGWMVVDCTQVRGWGFLLPNDTLWLSTRIDSAFSDLADTSAALRGAIPDSADVDSWGFLVPLDIATLPAKLDSTRVHALLDSLGGAVDSLLTIKKTLTFPIDNPLHLTADTMDLWGNHSLSTFTIDSVLAVSRGSVDDFDFSLVETPGPLGTGASTLIEAVTVSTETGGTFRKTLVTAIDHAAIQAEMSIGYVKSADSTNSITITIFGRWTN